MEETTPVMWKGARPTLFRRNYRISFCVMPDDVNSLEYELNRVASVLNEQRAEFPGESLVVSLAIHADRDSIPGLWKATTAHEILIRSLVNTKPSIFFMVEGRRYGGRKLLEEVEGRNG